MASEELKDVLERERGNLRQAMQVIQSSTRLLLDAVDTLEKVAKSSASKSA